MNKIISLDGDSARDAIDVSQRYEIFLEKQSEQRHKFGGSLKFEHRGNAEYLIRRPYKSTSKRSYGIRSEKTQNMLTRWNQDRENYHTHINGLRSEIERFAPIIKARGMGRVPTLTARIIRKFNDIGWLGKNLTIIGTNCLFAYEAKAGLRISSEVLSTSDIDVLHDARSNFSLSADSKQRGLVNVLSSVDSTFKKSEKKSYMASNKNGFMVELLEPQDHQKAMRGGSSQFSSDPSDLVAVSTMSSKWMLNAPKFHAVAFDEQGLPLKMVVIDPRLFALQKLWMVENDKSRDPIKRERDRMQANIVATIATQYLGMSFEDPELSGLPMKFMEMKNKIEYESNRNELNW